MDLLDYSEYLRELHGQDARGEIHFYPKDDVCPFCRGKTQEVFSKGIVEYDPEEKDSRQDVHHLVVVSNCNCGWWTILHRETPDAHNLYALPKSLTYLRGILRRFDVKSQSLPIESLRREIVRHPEVIDAISPKKMEELASSVMADFFPGCKSRICGRSGDGGVDLLLVMSDKPFAVQVKHRHRVDRGEPVHEIREFIGAMILAGVANGIYVTTAEHFSKASQDAASRIVSIEAVESFNLINRKAFLEMMEATATPNVSEPWLNYIPAWFRETSDRLTPYSLTV